MGGTLSKLGGLFNPTIGGTGQTASDLSKIGYSSRDLAALDPKKALFKGAITAGLGGLQGNDQGSQVPAPVIAQSPVMSPVDSGYFRPTDFTGPMQRSPIYG